MSALYSHAIRWEWTTTNPITIVRQSAKRQKIPEILTVDELIKLLDAIPEPFRTAVFLDGASVLRVGELLGLKWEDVDFERNVIHIKRLIVKQRIGPPKTEASQKPIPLNTELAKALRLWKMTLFNSEGKIPVVFLRRAGVPEDLISFVPSLVSPAIEFYSCFISYSHQDEEFSQRLHSRMRGENLRVWYAPEDMKGGTKLHEEIFSAIQIHDKVLLVLSAGSIKSELVTTEVRRARRVEREENRRKLFPIRLVDFGAIQKWECFDADSGKDLAIELREYYVPDFSNWKDHDAFEAEFAKLLRDLKATER